MKKMKHWAGNLCQIPLWDRCMLLIMVILLLECGYITLFKNASSVQDTSIDVVLRAAISSLFGYFLSSNFLNSQRVNHKQPFTDFDIENSLTSITPDISSKEIQPMQDIEEPSNGDELQFNEITDCHWMMRIKIVTAMGIFSIIMLIILRNSHPIHSDMMPFASMFANMTSGSLGYLIGYLPHNKPEQK